MLVPTVSNMMGMAMGLAKTYRDRLVAYLDFHGHSINRNVFAYGPHYKLQDVILYSIMNRIINFSLVTTNVVSYPKSFRPSALVSATTNVNSRTISANAQPGDPSSAVPAAS